MAPRRSAMTLIRFAVVLTPFAQLTFQHLPSQRRVGNASPRRYTDHADASALRPPPNAAPDGTAAPPVWEPWQPRREVDRGILHPFFKLGLVDDAAIDDILQREPDTAWLALLGAALLAAVLALPALPLVVAWRKSRWAEEVAASQDAHRAAFAAATASYRRRQRALVERLVAARTPGRRRDPLLPPLRARRIVAVTMATGQEGMAVVRELATSPKHEGTVVRALVRDPASAKARALASLSPRVHLCVCDSTSAASLRRALADVHAVYLCTTLNAAHAGTWAMSWDGGRYELRQGEAFAEAARGLPSLQQVVYGTAPMRKWPESFSVEPPIHYACKWRVEAMLLAAGLPVTFLRKCPYHENFTKLTKLEFEPSSPARVKAGTYSIRGLTPSTFEYNTMDPRDIGAWASIAFEHPSILIGESFSVAADCLTGAELADEATAAQAFGEGVSFEYHEQPRWVFEALSYAEPTFVYISGLQRWNTDGSAYDLTKEDVVRLRELHQGTTWREHLRRQGLEQFTATMADLLPDAAKTV